MKQAYFLTAPVGSADARSVVCRLRAATTGADRLAPIESLARFWPVVGTETEPAFQPSRLA
ncbi:MAG TPA: hypothetical protein PKC45_19450, partial [Gemmatales bacterium]|nr:hypothetical protein [Gemmatales bacterium]